MLISGTTGIDLTGLPINNTGNAEIEGNLNLTGAGKRITGDFSNATLANRTTFQTNTLNSESAVSVLPNGTATSAYFTAHNTSDTTNYSICSINCIATAARVSSTSFGTAPSLPLKFYVAGVDRATLDTNGNFLLLTGVLGYGNGAGGTVTQLTSKSTAVTLNKPTGQITMNNAALAAGASVEFTLNNSSIGSNDVCAVGGGAYSYNYTITAKTTIINSAVIRVTNVTGVSQSDPLVINYVIIKGAIS